MANVCPVLKLIVLLRGGLRLGGSWELRDRLFLLMVEILQLQMLHRCWLEQGAMRIPSNHN